MVKKSPPQTTSPSPTTTDQTVTATKNDVTSSLESKFFSILKAARTDLHQGRWVVAVSGGVDSAVLLSLCVRLASLYGVKLLVLHCDHQLRGERGVGESEVVRQWCEASGFEFQLETLDVEGFAAKYRLSLQESARVLRRQALLLAAAEFDATAIVTAHHASDATESFLMRLLRGAGTDGLSSMVLQDGLWLKPLIEFSREELEEYARTHALTFVEDTSNAEATYLRNRVRHELIPLLDRFLGQPLEPLLQRTLENLRQDAVYLDHVTRIEYQRWALHKKDEIAFDEARLQTAAPAIRRRLFQLAYSELMEGHLHATPLLERRHIEIIEACQTEHQLPGGVRVLRQRGQLVFYREPDPSQRSAATLPAVIQCPGVTDLERFDTRCVAVIQPYLSATPWKSASPMNAFIDWTKVEGPIRARRVHEADKIEVKQGVVVSCFDWLRDHQVPARQREEALVFEDAKGIIWLAPNAVSVRCWIGDETHIVLKLQLRPIKNIATTTTEDHRVGKKHPPKLTEYWS